MTAYDLLTRREPKTPIEKYIAQLSPEFISNANSELYRIKRGWIQRGVEEKLVTTFSENDKKFIIPKISRISSVGIDSSSGLFVICFFDNHLAGVKYLEDHIKIPKSSVGGGKEFKWQKLNRSYRKTITDNLERLINISCTGIFAINSNFINSDNHLTHSQMAGLIDGCFTGYDNNPTQNQVFRQGLREFFFSYCDGIPVHCDPDFQKVNPGDIVRIIVRQLSRKGKMRECTPSYATLRSHESLPIQLADIVAGCLSKQIQNDVIPPYPFKHLFFDERNIPKKALKTGRWAKGYYWLRSD